jgi:hypothetical protein
MRRCRQNVLLLSIAAPGRQARRHRLDGNHPAHATPPACSRPPLGRARCASLPQIPPRYRKSFTPFLPATVFFGPLRVRALVRVR